MDQGQTGHCTGKDLLGIWEMDQGQSSHYTGKDLLGIMGFDRGIVICQGLVTISTNFTSAQGWVVNRIEILFLISSSTLTSRVSIQFPRV
ncbi:hypothetical protein VNO77_44105 [Canavalia gladiata]|uniref:Uncharacterized protein n=1 Tax=Canavalia gladiata TaxID=3824 RepID=A0AAN9JXL0_CANGL